MLNIILQNRHHVRVRRRQFTSNVACANGLWMNLYMVASQVVRGFVQRALRVISRTLQ